MKNLENQEIDPYLLNQINSIEDSINDLFFNNPDFRQVSIMLSELLSSWPKSDVIENFISKLKEMQAVFLQVPLRNKAQNVMIKMIESKIEELQMLIIEVKECKEDDLAPAAHVNRLKQVFVNFSRESEQFYEFLFTIVREQQKDLSDTELLSQLNETITIVEMVLAENSSDSPLELQKCLKFLESLRQNFVFRKRYNETDLTNPIVQMNRLLNQNDKDLVEDLWGKVNAAWGTEDLDEFVETKMKLFISLNEIFKSIELVQFMSKLRHLHSLMKAEYICFEKCRRFNELFRNLERNFDAIFIELSGFMLNPLSAKYLNLKEIIKKLEMYIENNDCYDSYRQMLEMLRDLDSKYIKSAN